MCKISCMILRVLVSFILSAAAVAQSASEAAKLAPVSAAPAVAANEALASAWDLFKKGKFDDAVSAFQALVDKDPASAGAQAGLVRSLLLGHKVDAAGEAAGKALATLPTSALVHAAAGDVNFRAGKLGEAESEYKSALKLDENLARGWLGMARMYRVVSMNRHAKQALVKAHELDSEDRQIYNHWLGTLSYAEQLEAEKKTAGEHPTEREQQRLKYLSAVVEKKPWALASGIKPAEIGMFPYGREVTGTSDINRNGAVTIAKGFAVQVRFNDRAAAQLLVDTGADGVVIGRKLAEKAGVIKIADSSFGGIGDKGPVEGYVGWVDKILIGDVEFHNCIVQVSSKTDILDEAGLLGPAIFHQFLITLDFKERKLQLSPLPANPAATGDDELAQDRYIAPQMQGYTKAYRFGTDFVVPAIVSDKTLGNFLLDTGADVNSISPSLAAQVTKASAQGNITVRGVSGSVAKVQTGDKIILQFAKMRIESHDLPVFSTEGISRSEGTEIAGLIGIRTLSQMKMTIDYRDGLIDLQVYQPQKARE